MKFTLLGAAWFSAMGQRCVAASSAVGIVTLVVLAVVTVFDVSELAVAAKRLVETRRAAARGC